MFFPFFKFSRVSIFLIASLGVFCSPIQNFGNPKAEAYISKILTKTVPFKVEINGCIFLVDDSGVYCPGVLSKFFSEYLTAEKLFQGKVVADLGCASCALGIAAAKNGATQVIATDVSDAAIRCARNNCVLNDVQDKVKLFQGDSVEPVLQDYAGKIDIIVAGAPWDSLSKEAFEQFDESRKALSRSFYDIDDRLISGIMKDGFSLLAPEGRVFITSSNWALPRVQDIASKFNVACEIVCESVDKGCGDKDFIVELKKGPLS